MEAFPYVQASTRKIVGKPEMYKGWTIWHYKLWCQQIGSSKGEWSDMTLAVRNGEVIVGAVFQIIDEMEVHE